MPLKAGLLAAGLSGSIWWSGCANQETLRAREQAAFYAGQAQALSQQQKPTILVIGNVAHPKVDWVEGLTLVRALIQAEWQGRNDPRGIILRRPGSTINIAPEDLYREQEEGPLLQPGDVIELRP
jgi:hypothetical protein